jgi:orotate phosphoribosyltransferase
MSDMSFAEFIASTNAVRFGDITLKSGKKSNVFFDFGQIYSGQEMIKTGEYFADFIIEKSLDNVDALFGPAYKGINISIATSIALFTKHNVSIPFVYNRKVPKEHAEKGRFVGCKLDSVRNILILDDVITDGGTKYEVLELLSPYKNINIAAMIVGVDRQEVNDDNELMLPLFVKNTGIQVLSITTKEEVLKHHHE